MKDRDKSELDYYSDLAKLAVAQANAPREKVNEHAKKAFALIRSEIPDADDDAMVDFMANIAFMMARLMNMKLGDVADTMDRIFTNSVLIVGSLLGVYDLEDGESGPPFEELLAEIAKERSQADPESGEMSDAEWEAMLKKQFL